MRYDPFMLNGLPMSKPSAFVRLISPKNHLHITFVKSTNAKLLILNRHLLLTALGHRYPSLLQGFWIQNPFPSLSSSAGTSFASEISKWCIVCTICTLKCIFLKQRLLENHAGRQSDPGCKVMQPRREQYGMLSRVRSTYTRAHL